MEQRTFLADVRAKPIYQKPRTSDPHPQHPVYPYLLKDLAITRPNQVWCADITYIPMRKGFLYLVAVMDWATRKVLAWKLSNTMEADFCIEALQDALARFGAPEIFNTDQGSQFTSPRFTQVLKDAKVRISMGTMGRCILPVFQYTARLVLPLLRQHIFASPGEVQGFLDLARRGQSALGVLVERRSTPSGSGLYGCDLSAEAIGTWASLGLVTVVSPEGEMRRCADPILWRRTPTDTISITDRGRELAGLIHKDCWGPGILRRLQEWADAGIDTSRPAMESYIRRYFGKQLTFIRKPAG